MQAINSSILPFEETELKSFFENQGTDLRYFTFKETDLLTKVEQLVLWAWGNSYYKQMNDVAAGLSTDSQFARINQTAINALSKLPKDQNDKLLYRKANIEEKDINKFFIPGKTLIFKRFMSTSLFDMSSSPFLYKKNALFLVKGESGRYIKDYSASPSEEEVLFPPRCKFLIDKVKSVTTYPNIQWEIHMTEVIEETKKISTSPETSVPRTTRRKKTGISKKNITSKKQKIHK